MKEPSVERQRGVWQNAPGTPAPAPARPARASAAAPAGRLDRGCAPGGVAPQPGPCPRRARRVCRCPGATTGEATSRTASAPRGAVSLTRAGAVPAVWLCLLGQTHQPEGPEGQAPRVRVFPLLGDRCVSLWRRARLSELTFRTLFRSSEAILSEPPEEKGGRARPRLFHIL